MVSLCPPATGTNEEAETACCNMIFHEAATAAHIS